MASETRTLRSAPSILPLYAKAAAPLLPGASILPFVPGGGGEIPEIELELPGVLAEPKAVADYSRVCGFALRDALPPTYPHALAFPLHMALMADGRFPFGAVGLVHLANLIRQHRPIGAGEELVLRARPTALEPHPKGRTFTIVTEARAAGGELAWESTSTFLRRGSGDEKASADKADRALDPETPASATWKLGGDLGRRYAAVSGDRNPIHLHALTAKPLGFPSPIAHGMWTKARCLAALETRLPDAFAVEVRFRRPIFLPAKVEFAAAENEFAVRDARKATPHLDGSITPEKPDPKTKAKSKAKTETKSKTKPKTGGTK